MAKGDAGGIKAWKPKDKAADGTAPATNPTGRRDGGARLASGVRDGNVREWQPKPGAAKPGAGALKSYTRGTAPLAPSATAATPSATTPCVGCGGAQIKLVAGTKAGLRSKLVDALGMATSFLLGLFDGALVEADSGAPASFFVSAHGPWEAAGFHVSEHGGSIVVGSVIGNSPAGHAGLEPNDVIAAIEDEGRPTSLGALAAGWAKGDKFDGHRLIIERNGSQLALDIATS